MASITTITTTTATTTTTAAAAAAATTATTTAATTTTTTADNNIIIMYFYVVFLQIGAHSPLQSDEPKHKFEDVTLVELMYLVFTRMPGESYRRRLRSLLLYLCYVFRVLINSLVC